MVAIACKVLTVVISALSFASVVLAYSVDNVTLANGRTSATPGERIAVHFDTSLTQSSTEQYSIAFALTTADDSRLKTATSAFPFTAVDVTKVDKGQGTMQKGFDVEVTLPYNIKEEKVKQKWKLATAILNAGGRTGLMYVTYLHTDIDIRFP